MNKPIYKKWWFWVVLVLVIGAIGNMGNNTSTTDEATPTASVEPAQAAIAEATAEPTEAPTAVPTVVPTEMPKPTLAPTVAPTEAPAASANWESEIAAIAASDGSETEKADAAESLAKKYEPNNEELFSYFEYLVGELANKTYLNQIENDKYMLTNIFKSVLVEKYAQNDHLKDFAFDFYQNTKYTYRGVDAVDSESVLSNEEQMAKALSQIQIQ